MNDDGNRRGSAPRWESGTSRKSATQIGTYPSLFEFEGRGYFWYRDRKHYLPGRILTPELLDDASLPR